MDEAKADIMMYFKLAGGGSLNGESSLQVDAKVDKFLDGFVSSASAQQYSNFFEVADFNFSLRVNSGERGGGSYKPGGKEAAKLLAVPGGHGGVQKAPDEYERWRSAEPEQLKKMKYQIDFGTFSFKRTFDAASPIFFQNCANQVSFQEAALVKRIQARVGQDLVSMGYMRVEFTDVMMTKIAWDDGDVVKENCSCKCKKLVVKYKRQAMDGTLSASFSTSTWDQSKHGLPPDASVPPGGR